MRIGILGLGRIGVFHAETLAGLGAVESGPPRRRGPRGPPPNGSGPASPTPPRRCWPPGWTGW
jgi:hypothetical protein